MFDTWSTTFLSLSVSARRDAYESSVTSNRTDSDLCRFDVLQLVSAAERKPLLHEAGGIRPSRNRGWAFSITVPSKRRKARDNQRQDNRAGRVRDWLSCRVDQLVFDGSWLLREVKNV